MKIKILSMKELISLLRNREINSEEDAFVVSSSFPMEERLKELRHCIFAEYQDFDTYRPGLSLSEKTASDIATFLIMQLDSNADKTFCFVCDTGVRRSSAVCASFLHYLNATEEEEAIWSDPHKEPNPLVFKMLCTALNSPIGDSELNQRLRINRDAIHNAYRKNR